MATYKVKLGKIRFVPDQNQAYVSWSFNKKHTKEYKVVWKYYARQAVIVNGQRKIEGKWFPGTEETTKKKTSVYSVPSNAYKIAVYVKPVSTTYKDKKKKKDVNYFTGASVSTSLTVRAENLKPGIPSGISFQMLDEKRLYVIATGDDLTDKIKFEIYRPEQGNKFDTATVTSSTPSKVKAARASKPSSGGGKKLDNLQISMNVKDIASTIANSVGKTGAIASNAAKKVAESRGTWVPAGSHKTAWLSLDAEGNASYTHTIAYPGYFYKVRAVAYNEEGKATGDWSALYPSDPENIYTNPVKVTGVKAVTSQKEGHPDLDSLNVSWNKVYGATKYQIQYTSHPNGFNNSNLYTIVDTDDAGNFRIIDDLPTGFTYYIRVRAVNDKASYEQMSSPYESGAGPWSDTITAVVAKPPAAPTTWSSRMVVEIGDPVSLFWTHNSVDESDMKGSKVWYKVGDGAAVEKYVAPKYDDVLGMNSPQGEYILDTKNFPDQSKMQWKVQTRGISPTYSPYSVTREVSFFEPPSVNVKVSQTPEIIGGGEDVTRYPFYILASADPPTQKAIGFYVVISPNTAFQMTQPDGTNRWVNAGEALYEEFFDFAPSEDPIEIGDRAVVVGNNLTVRVTPSMLSVPIDVDADVEFTAYVSVSMNSGLTADQSVEFGTTFEDQDFNVNATITPDEDTLTVSILPQCRESFDYIPDVEYPEEPEIISVTGFVNEDLLEGETETVTVPIETEYYNLVPFIDISREGTDVELASVSASVAESGEIEVTATGPGHIGQVELTVSFYEPDFEDLPVVTGSSLAVYRHEQNGEFTLIQGDIPGEYPFSVTDPHPALRSAIYRIVATSTTTGSIVYEDMEPVDLGETGCVIQWDEEVYGISTNTFYDDNGNIVEQDTDEVGPWSGSRIILPANLDIQNSTSPDVDHVAYDGRKRPVSYFGTQLGETGTWSGVFPKYDKITIEMFRRLQAYMGNVYVREPSGLGYWATVKVDMPVNHLELTVPVTLNLTRVEGGI